MKWVIGIIVVILVFIIVLYLRGASLPVKHTATVAKEFNKSPEELWAIVTDTKNFGSWRRGLKWVEVIDDRNWKETTSQGDEVLLRATTWEPGKKLATQILNTDLPFGGEWVYEFEAIPEGTRLTITENGEVYSPVFRFMSKYIFGHDTTLKGYLEDLEIKVNKTKS